MGKLILHRAKGQIIKLQDDTHEVRIALAFKIAGPLPDDVNAILEQVHEKLKEIETGTAIH